MAEVVNATPIFARGFPLHQSRPDANLNFRDRIRRAYSNPDQPFFYAYRNATLVAGRGIGL